MSRPRGFALAAALFALVLLSALAAAGFAAALGEWRAGRSSFEGIAAAVAARSGLAAAMRDWDPRWSGEMRPGEERDLGAGGIQGSTWQVRTTRLSTELLIVRSVGRSSGGSGRRELGLVARFQSMRPFPAAAARVRIPPSSVAATGLSGAGAVPSGWDCPPVTDSVPALLVDSTSPDESFFGLGGRTWSEVVAWAEAVPSGGDSLGVRFARERLVLTGDRVLGTLLVDGDLELRGGAEVVGSAVVRGEVVVGGGGGRIVGALVTRSIRLLPEAFPASLQVEYSVCSVALAGGSRAPLEPLPGASRLPLW